MVREEDESGGGEVEIESFVVGGGCPSVKLVVESPAMDDWAVTNDSMTDDTLLFFVIGGGRSGEKEVGARAASVTANAEGCGSRGEVCRRGPGARSRLDPDA